LNIYFIKRLTAFFYFGSICVMFTFAHSLNQGFGRRQRQAHASCAHVAGSHAGSASAWRATHRECALLSASVLANINPGLGYTLQKLLGMEMDAHTNSGRVLI
jgi:hypothetical protein